MNRLCRGKDVVTGVLLPKRGKDEELSYKQVKNPVVTWYKRTYPQF